MSETKDHSTDPKTRVLEETVLSLAQSLVKSAWAELMHELEFVRTVVVQPWPKDAEREKCVRMARDGASRATTFGGCVPFGPSCGRALEERMRGLVAAILEEREAVGAGGFPIFVRVEPSAYLLLSGEVGVRCRVGFGQNPESASVVVPAQPGEVERRTCLTDDQLAREEARRQVERER